MEIVLIISYLLLGVAVICTAVVPFCWESYYFIFHRNLLYVFGLVFSRSLTNYAVVGVLMWYFTYYEGDLVTSAILSNFQEALSSILVIVMANMADSFVGRYRTLLFSNTAYIGGLWLMWMFNPYDVKWLIVIILVLLAIGTSGNNLVDNVLIDLVKDIDTSQDKEQYEARAAFWGNTAAVAGAIAATIWVASDSIGGVQDSWRTTFLICIIIMMITVAIFVNGYKVYGQDELIQRPIKIFLRVCRELFRMLFQSNRRRSTSTSGHEEDTRRKFFKHDLIIVKRFLILFPLWAEFILVSLVSATGSTFFFEQYNNLNSNDKIPVQIYNLMQGLSAFLIPYVFQRACPSRFNNEKVKTGVGMLFAVICCVFAWILERYRLDAVNHLVDKDAKTSISFLWLLPQFCALGCMEGLVKEGLLEFYKSIVDGDFHKYGEEYIELVLGFGKLLNVVMIFFLGKIYIFSYTINDSRLDLYYRYLFIACLVNLVFYGNTV